MAILHVTVVFKDHVITSISPSECQWSTFLTVCPFSRSGFGIEVIVSLLHWVVKSSGNFRDILMSQHR